MLACKHIFVAMLQCAVILYTSIFCDYLAMCVTVHRWVGDGLGVEVL